MAHHADGVYVFVWVVRIHTSRGLRLKPLHSYGHVCTYMYNTVHGRNCLAFGMIIEEMTVALPEIPRMGFNDFNDAYQ